MAHHKTKDLSQLPAAPQRANQVPIAGAEYEGLGKAARRFGVSRTTLWRRYKEGAFDGRLMGNKTLVRIADVRRWLESLPTGTNVEAA